VQFRQTIINTVATVKGYYYELLFAIDNLVAAQTNLELAKKLLGENEIRVKVGTMARSTSSLPSPRWRPARRA